MTYQICALLQRGSHHPNFCEDNLFYAALDDQHLLLAVMDGCTMGEQSYFASALIGKLLKKIAKSYYYQQFVHPKTESTTQLLRYTLQQLFADLKQVKNNYLLDRNELLSTLILSVINIENRHAEIIAIGDGAIEYNQQLIEYEQDNQPDYIAYHLDKNFNTWFGQHQQFLSLSSIKSLSLCTDGLFTLEQFNHQDYSSFQLEKAIDYLLYNQLKKVQVDYQLQAKLIQLEQKYGLKPSDDLAILQVHF